MVKCNHVYTLSYDLNTLCPTQNANYQNKLVASPNYYIKEDREATTYKMIESFDDLFAILRTKHNNNQVINLILNNNMVKLFCELMESGSEPSSGYQAGRLY